MTFADAVRSGFRNYATLTGRASRSEYWYWVLFTVLAALAATLLESVVPMRALDALVNLAVLLPSIAVSVRRLHDIGRSGWWLLVVYAPFVLGAFAVSFAMVAFIAFAVGGGEQPARGTVAVASLGVGLVLFLAGLAYAVYLFTRPSQPRANEYGPPPGAQPLRT